MATRIIDQVAPARPGAGVHSILVVANETVGGRALLREIERRTRGKRGAVHVVAPALVESRVKFALADVDEARELARARLEKSLAALAQLDVDATGDVGDADPNLAIEDALRLFPADEVIISTHPSERSTWLENSVVEQAQRDLNLPVTHVVVDLEAETEEDKVPLVERFQPRADGRRAEDQTDYLPPMPFRDRLTLLVGIVGTVILGILALTGTSDGSFGGAFAVQVGLAAAAFFITLWHSVALLLMGSVRYRGFFQDAAADMVLFGVPPAVVVSLLIA
jgi:hypothetical protein